MAALCSHTEPKQLLPHRTAAATALAAFASQPANANCIRTWLSRPVAGAPRSAEANDLREDGNTTAIAQHPGQEPETAGTDGDKNKTAKPSSSGASKRSRALMGNVAALVTCSTADVR